MGFQPHLIYDPQTRVEEKLPPRVERKEDLNIDSTRLVGSSVESWDHALVEDINELYS